MSKTFWVEDNSENISRYLWMMEHDWLHVAVMENAWREATMRDISVRNSGSSRSVFFRDQCIQYKC